MKSAKKLLLLVLSLVLLVGIFAFIALADEETNGVLTVEYQDGTVQTYKEGDTVAAYAVPSEFVTMIDGKGYKFTAAAGATWTYSEPVPTTVTADDLGKTITATTQGETGTEQVYATVKLVFSDVDYYKWIVGEMGTKVNNVDKSNAVFVKAGTSGTDQEFTVYANGAEKTYTCSYDTVKRDAGTYMLYFTDPAKLGRFFTTSEKTEVNGKMLDYQDFRTGGNTGSSVSVKLYADHTMGNVFCWGKNGYDRPNTEDVSGKIAQNTGGTAPVTFDMNGYNVTVTSTSRLELRAMPLTLYSSKPGAHWYHLNATNAFYVSDDGVLYIGNSSTSHSTYSDNLYVHCQRLFQGHYGSGAYITGGHYYQTATPGCGFVLVSRRVNNIKDAKFYVLPGQSVFYDDSGRNGAGVTDGTKVIENCEFYSTDRSAIVFSQKAYSYNNDGSVKSTTTPSAVLRFNNCTFYGATLAVAGDANTAVYAASADGKTTYTNTFKQPVVFNTVTWADGSVEYYYAHNLDEAKAFAETCNRPAVATEGETYEKKVGTEMYLVTGTPNFTFTYDGDLNAKYEDTTEGGIKVAFAVYLTDGTPTYYVIGTGESTDTVKYLADASAADTQFKTILNQMPRGGATIEMYSDRTIKTSDSNFMTRGEKDKKYQLDLKGNTLTITATGIAIDQTAAYFYLYSSLPGGVINASTATYFTRTNNAKTFDSVDVSGRFYFGEDMENSATDYSKNITVYCKRVNGDLYGTSFTIYGGTFIQTAKNDTYFLVVGRKGSTGNNQLAGVSNATFVITKAGTSFIEHSATSAKTFKNCNFISATGDLSPLFVALGSTGSVFNDCGFYNVDPVATFNSKAVNYSGTTYCAYTVDAPVKEGKVLARTKGRSVVADGVTYDIDSVYVTEGNTVTVHWGSIATEQWTTSVTIACKPEYLIPLSHYVKQDDGTTDYFYGAYADPADLMCLQKADYGKEITVDILFETAEDIAFAYRDLATDAIVNVFYADCDKTELGVGEKFHEIFNAPDAGYEITMFRDMRLTKAVPFGEYVKEHDTSNRDYYNTLSKGSIIWDLNGTTVTIDENVTGLVRLNAANTTYKDGAETWTGDTVFGFEGYNSTNTFTLKSSLEGGKIVNESTAHLFGTGEGKRTKIIILGENLTIDAGKGYAINYKELNRDNSSYGNRLEIDGGTFIGGNNYVIRISMSASIKNATIISTNASAYGMIAFDGYRTGTTVLMNNVFVGAKAGGTDLMKVQDSSSKQNVTVDGCTLYNVKAAQETTSLTPLTYTGNNVAASEADLAIMYPTEPVGAVMAYNTADFGGVTYVTVAYYTDASYVTMQNVNLETEQNWIVGSIFTLEEITGGIAKMEDGVYYYAAEAVWKAKIGGASVALDALTAADNAGKIVVIEAEGDYLPVYFTVTVSGQTTYYTADTYATDFQTVLTNPQNSTTYEIKLYSNIKTATENGVQVIGKKNTSGGTTYKIDLNGYTWEIGKINDTRAQYAILVSSVISYIYSSVPGGVLDTVSAAQGIICVDSSGYARFGEPSTSSTEFGKNFTVYCDAIAASEIWSTEVRILGGTYIKNSNTATSYFVDTRRTVPIMKNATFIMKNVTYFARGMRLGTMENCTVISETEMKLFNPIGLPGFVASTDKEGNPVYNKDLNTTFTSCSFYNVIPNTYAEIEITYTDCNFNKASDIAQAGGYIAYTGETVTITVNGQSYAFGSKLVADAALVEWGFGMREYWAVGATATHKNTVVDGVFGYTFESLTVAEGTNTAKKKLAAIKPGTLQMNLVLQSKIGVNLFVNAALSNATVTFGGEKYTLADLVAEGGYYAFDTAIAPNVADIAINVEITIGDNTHIVPVSVGEYAEKILGSATYANAHNLTYAMVEYVRAAAGNTDFLAEVKAPVGYEAQTLTSADSGNKGTLLSSIAFRLGDTIAIAIQSAKDGENFVAEGKTVTLKLGNGRKVTATVNNGKVLFENLYVNEFYGNLTITIETETYNYSLANYLKGIENEYPDEATAVKALYNYAYHADAYVKAQ